MTDQSSRFRKYGIYTMDIRQRRGMRGLPMPGGGAIGPNIQQPIQTTSPSASAGWGTIPGTIRGTGVGMFPAMYRDRIANAATAGAGLARVSQPAVATALSALHRSLLSISVDGNGNVPAQSVKAIMDLALSADAVHRLNDGLVTYWPGETVESIERKLIGAPVGSSPTGTTPSKTIDWQSNFNPRAGGGMLQSSQTSGAAIGASSSASVPNAVQASQDARSTQIDGGGNSPYYGPTTDGGSSLPVGPTAPPAWSLPSWVVPVLAAAGGAALGAVTIRALVG